MTFLTNLRPSTRKVQNSALCDPFWKKCACISHFGRLTSPHFVKNNKFYLSLKKSFPTEAKLFWCVNFQKLYKIKIVKRGNLLQISLLLVFEKNKNENVSKFDDSMSNYLTYNLTWNKYNLTLCQIFDTESWIFDTNSMIFDINSWIFDIH